MPNKMERFTQRARRVLTLAQEEAERLQHRFVGSEHILLGLMRVEDGAARQVLSALGVTEERLKEQVDQLSHAASRVPDTPVDLSPATKKLLEHAVVEARRMSHPFIGTEHLLLGLARETDSTAMKVLASLGISAEAIRGQTRRVLESNPASQRAPTTPPSPPPSPAETLASERMKVLQMVEEGKISAQEGTQLLSTLQSSVVLGAGLLPAALLRGAKRRLRLVITDKAAGTTKIDLPVPMPQIVSGMDAVLRAVMEEKTGKIGEMDDELNGHIEIFIEDAPETE